MTETGVPSSPAFPRTLAEGQRCLVHVATADGTVEEVFATEDLLLEAPNWSRDGRFLVLNGDGALWTLELESRELARVEIDGLPPINNDHVLDADEEHVFLSAMDGQIYRAPLHGGSAERITDDPGMLHFLHGVSPDGAELASIDIPRPEGDAWGDGVVALLAGDGTALRTLTAPGSHADGSEYSPDGEWIHFNTEHFDGHAQIARIRRDGAGLEQLTSDANVNWFPHLAPQGELAVYLAFPPGTMGHPADLQVELKLVRAGAWSTPETLLALPGGQGTINVNSWSPDGSRFAFVSYPGR